MPSAHSVYKPLAKFHRYKGHSDVTVSKCMGSPISVHRSSQVQLSRGEQYAQQVNALFCETSALDATNVEELFIRISKYSLYGGTSPI